MSESRGSKIAKTASMLVLAGGVSHEAETIRELKEEPRMAVELSYDVLVDSGRNEIMVTMQRIEAVYVVNVLSGTRTLMAANGRR